MSTERNRTTGHETETRHRAFVRWLFAMLIAVAAGLSMGQSCDVSEPNRCEQMDGYCAEMGAMCDPGFQPMAGMECSTRDMVSCCIPTGVDTEN